MLSTPTRIPATVQNNRRGTQLASCWSWTSQPITTMKPPTL